MPYNVGFAIGGNVRGGFSGGNPDTFTPGGDDAGADGGTIGNDLSGGRSVLITTGSGGSQAGNLTVDAGFTLSSTAGASLGLQAAGAIAVQYAFSLRGGPLNLMAGGAITQSASIAVDTLAVNGASGVTLTSTANQIGSLGALTASGDAALTDAQALTLSGATNVGAHALTLTTTNGDLTISGPVTAGATTFTSSRGAVNDSGGVALAGALTVTAAQASLFSGAITGNSPSASLTQAGAGTLTLTAGDTYAGGTTISAGTLRIGNGGTSGAIAGDVTDNATLQFSRSDSTSFGGVISGSGALRVDSGGTLTLSATNTYGGGTTVTGGGTLIVTTSSTGYGSAALGSGAVTLDGGALSSDNRSITNNIALGAGGGTFLAFDSNHNPTIASAVTGSGDLTFRGSGTSGQVQFGGLVSGGSDAHTGATLLTGGVQVTALRSLSSTSTVQIDNGSSLRAYSDQTLGALNGAGGAAAYQNTVRLTVGVSGADGDFTGVISNGSGSLSLAKSGAGVQILAGANTYTGGTTLNAGVFDLAHATAGAYTAITSGAAGTGPITFSSGAQTLRVEQAALDGATSHQLFYKLASFGVADGDVVDVRGVTSAGAATYDGSDLLTLRDGAGAVAATLHIGAGYGGDVFNTVVDSDGLGVSVSAAVAPPTPEPPPPSGPQAGSHVLASGTDRYQAGASGEIVYGEGGSDTLLGGAGADTLVAGGYDGQATQGSTSDRVLIEGGSGADSLVGGIGHDQIFGQMGDDRILVAAGSQGDSAYGGQGNDYVDASRSNAANYLSGDVGNDTLLSGAGFETVLGGQGDDVIVGGSRAGAGSLQLLFGNQGNDTLSYAGAGSVEMFGGQDDDTLAVTTSGQGRTHYLFGNLGDDTLTASGGYNSLYGGQGNDVVSAANDLGGHNYLSGDIGDDTLSGSMGHSDTLRGGAGADTITLSGNFHTYRSPDTVFIGQGESTAMPGAGESNLDHVSGFLGSDRLVIVGHASGTTANVSNYADSAASAGEPQAFAAAYLYAYGDGTAAHTAHAGATEYLSVVETIANGDTYTYLFTADHTAIAFYDRVDAASGFAPGAIVGG